MFYQHNITEHLSIILFSFSLKTLNLNKVEGDVHVAFNKLFAELNKEGAPYALSLANRLYGEKTFKFVEVRPSASHRQHSHWHVA